MNAFQARQPTALLDVFRSFLLSMRQHFSTVLSHALGKLKLWKARKPKLINKIMGNMLKIGQHQWIWLQTEASSTLQMASRPSIDVNTLRLANLLCWTLLLINSLKWILFLILDSSHPGRSPLSLALFNHSWLNLLFPWPTHSLTLLVQNLFKGYELKFAFLYIWFLYVKVKSPFIELAPYSFPASSPPKCILFSKIKPLGSGNKTHTFFSLRFCSCIPQPGSTPPQPAKSYLFFRIKLKYFCT